MLGAYAKILRVCFLVFIFSIGEATAHARTAVLDRPWSLSEGMTEIELDINWNYRRSSEILDLEQPIPLSIRASHALSDRFSFIWFVLPTGFRYQLQKSDRNQVGIEFFNHVEDPEIPALSEYLTIIDRYRVSAEVDLESKMIVLYRLLFKEGRSEHALAFQWGPRWEFTPGFVLRGWLGVLQERAESQPVWSLLSGTSLTWSPAPGLDLEVHTQGIAAGSRARDVANFTGFTALKFRW